MTGPLGLLDATALLAGPSEVAKEALDTLANGVTIDGIRYGAVEAVLDRSQGSNHWLTLALREGKNREVRALEGDRLVGADRASEGGAILGVLGRQLEARLAQPLLLLRTAHLDACPLGRLGLLVGKAGRGQHPAVPDALAPRGRAE